jgi:hypothetical protein
MGEEVAPYAAVQVAAFATRGLCADVLRVAGVSRCRRRFVPKRILASGVTPIVPSADGRDRDTRSSIERSVLV